jgi:hypothetical protein
MEPGTLPALHGALVADCFGVPVGVVEDLLVATASNRPAWLVVALDDGGRRTVVPHAGSRAGARATRIPFPAERVRSCPVGAGGAALTREDALPACLHYGVRAPVDGLVAVRASAAAPVAIAA